MPEHLARVLIVAIAAVCAAVPAAAQDRKPDTQPEIKVYVPPRVGAPKRRVGAGTRGVDADHPAVFVIDPEHLGLTVAEQPVLYWFVSGPARTETVIELIDGDGEEPLLEARLEPVVEAGFHALDLARHGVRLKPDVRYQWSVTLIVDPDSPSKDRVSAGAIQRIVPPPELRARLASAAARDRPGIYASEGLWYDAIAAISTRIAENPGDPALRMQRAAWLEQVSLDQPAAFDRAAAR